MLTASMRAQPSEGACRSNAEHIEYICGQLALECQPGMPQVVVLALNTAMDVLEVGGVSMTGRNLF